MGHRRLTPVYVSCKTSISPNKQKRVWVTNAAQARMTATVKAIVFGKEVYVFVVPRLQALFVTEFKGIISPVLGLIERHYQYICTPEQAERWLERRERC